MSIRYININGSNVEVEDNTARTNIGTLSNLSTTNKSSVVNAINENVGKINSLESNVETVQTGLAQIIKSKLSSPVSLTISANTSSSFAIPMTMSGYTLIGVITYNVTGKNSSNCMINGCTINANGDGVTLRIKNTATSEVTWQATAKGLFIRNDLV